MSLVSFIDFFFLDFAGKRPVLALTAIASGGLADGKSVHVLSYFPHPLTI